MSLPYGLVTESQRFDIEHKLHGDAPLSREDRDAILAHLKDAELSQGLLEEIESLEDEVRELEGKVEEAETELRKIEEERKEWVKPL